jgi:hypothetical protein
VVLMIFSLLLHYNLLFPTSQGGEQNQNKPAQPVQGNLPTVSCASVSNETVVNEGAGWPVAREIFEPTYERVE